MFLLFWVVAFGQSCSDAPSAPPLSGKGFGSEQVAAKGLKLTWSEPFNATKLGTAADPLLEGKAIGQIITSAVSGRDDGLVCSSCHNRTEAAGGYGVDVEAGKPSPLLKPSAKIGPTARAWIGPGSWAEGFIKNKTKPDNLKAMMQAWIDGGYK